jgi:Arc/MetJ family transcription regulator
MIEVDEDLRERAKRASGCPTTRATIEEALRRAADRAEYARDERAARRHRYLERLSRDIDVDMLALAEM